MCRVAPLVEHCDTCLWLLSAWRWLVVGSGEVLLEFFLVGSGRSKSELLTGVSRVAVGNRVLCRVLPTTEWVADWLVPTARSVGGCSRVVSAGVFHCSGWIWRRSAPVGLSSHLDAPHPWVVARPSGPLARVREVGSLQLVSERGSTELFKELITIAVPKEGVRLPCMIRARVAGCSCCSTACVASVVARRVRAVAARLALDSLAVVFIVWRMLASQSRCGAPGRLRRI
ncbi:hypothetical protein Taro_014462 [Colocasia esculenta]|uniref:Uncharacterized protein n=1 Tax=Colocasia esculenta TaxID=4460 RepID=A0A843UEZ4_COLES|nr:hypothetical protein [Colocasia esculenta]